MNPPSPAVTPPSRVERWAGPFFLLCCVVLVPWTVYLAVTLPQRSVSAHYALAWAGFDAMLAGSLLATGTAAYRGSPWLAVLAPVTGTLLVVDAWFDVLTSSERLDVVQAVLLAVLIELPLAALCGWLAVHSEQVELRRLVVALRARRRRRADRRAGAAGTKGTKGTSER